MKARALPNIVWIGIVAALAGLLAILYSGYYEGKPLSYWIKQAPGSDRESMVLRQVPKEKVLPILKDWLVATDSPFKLRVLRLLQRPKVIPLPFYLAHQKRSAAINAIFVLGPDAAPLAEDVAKLFRSNHFSTYEVGFALATMGSNAAPFLQPCDPRKSFIGCRAKDAAREMQSTPEFANALAEWKLQTSADIARFRQWHLRKCSESHPPEMRIWRLLPTPKPRIPWHREVTDPWLRVAFAEHP